MTLAMVQEASWKAPDKHEVEFCPGFWCAILQVALGIGHSMFLVEPDSEKGKDFEGFEPEEAVSEATNPEAAEGTKGAAGKGKGTKRKADAPAAKKGKGKK